MARNTGKGHRIGAVKKRSQFLNDANGNYMKRDDKGRFVSGKKDAPYKGVRMEAVIYDPKKSSGSKSTKKSKNKK